MIIQHNIAALNSHRQLGINNANTNKNLEKLSSGYRINRAGDDAAGLAISEKMRGQIRGLSQAEMNTSHAINLIQTAEGGLQETHAILQRMRELAVQSSNGTYDNDVDRANLQKEVEALKSEINRISTATHYNGINLLDATINGEVGTSTKGAAALAALNLVGTGGTTFLTTTGAAYNGKEALLVRRDNGTYFLQIGDEIFEGSTPGATVTFRIADDPAPLGTDHCVLTINLTGSNTAVGSASFTLSTALTAGNFNVSASGVTDLTFQIGANGTADQQVSTYVKNMCSGNLGDATKALYISGITIATQTGANAAIDAVDAAINQVSSVRADLGALQNRLEHTMNNLGVTKENLTAAESTIRDVDMAKEMMEYTKNTILVQASQAMLAQAQTLPQGVLNLLR